MSSPDLETKFTLDDGTEVSLGELLQSRKDLESALEINDTLQKDLDEVAILFQADSTVEQKENVVRNVLQNSGYEEDQIDQYLQASRRVQQETEFEEPEEEPEEIDLPDLPEDDEDLEDVTDDEISGGAPQEQQTMSDEMANAMQAQMEAQRAEIHKMRVRELRQSLDTQLDRVLKTNPDFQRLLETSRTLRGDDGVKQAEQALRSQLEQRALDRMQSRRASAGTFEDAWMAEEVERAAEPVLGTFRSVIGDIDKLGRSSETVTGLDAQEILRSKPVPEPEYKAGASFSDLESQVKGFASDTIKRALAESSTPSAI